MADADLGNPNFFKTFLGRFEADLPDGGKAPVMLTAMNEVCMMLDLTADSDGLLMTLPEQCRPKNPVRFACVVESRTARETARETVVVARQTGTVKGSVKTSFILANVPRAAGEAGMTASQYDAYATDAVQIPVLSNVDIPVLENVTLDIGSGDSGSPGTAVTVEPDGRVIGTPNALHRLNGRGFYVIDRYYL